MEGIDVLFVPLRQTYVSFTYYFEVKPIYIKTESVLSKNCTENKMKYVNREKQTFVDNKTFNFINIYLSFILVEINTNYSMDQYHHKLA